MADFILLKRITPNEGDLPIFAVNKKLFGSIGISAAPGGEKDVAQVQTGVNKMAGKL